MMATTDALSISRPSRKVKERAPALPTLATTGTPSPKKGKGGRTVGAKQWTIQEFLRLFRVVAAVCPQGHTDWQVVSADHSEASATERSSAACKGQWGMVCHFGHYILRLSKCSPIVQVLKLPKPTGKTKPHPIHHLALAVNDHMSKAKATRTLNDADPTLDEELYDELGVEFAKAEKEMACLGLN
jgi:hypothetical protein